MNKNTPVTMAAAMAVAGILTLAVMTMALQHQAFAQAYNQGSDNNDKKQETRSGVAVGGNGGSGGAGGAGGEGGQGGKNVAEDSGKNVGDDSDKCCCKDPGNTKIDQHANGGSANGGQGGNANGGDART
jgi:hypothetical protein